MTSAGPHPGLPPAARRLPHIPEERTAALVDQDLALEAARAAFAATVDGPVFASLAVHGSAPRNRFTLGPFASATHDAYRTAAVDALAVDLPARPDATILAVLVVGRTVERAERTAAALAALGHEARVAGAEEAWAGPT
ncbi:hypothetical protein ACFYZ2_35670 [Streptomyces sviceus]|uniref:hypothetical protein n=1 Tax=Streptomyces sviceus TaxID=285530 RepID=UPI0036A8F3AD